MATEIGRLTAVFEAQTQKFDAGVKTVEQKLNQTAKTARVATQSVKTGLDDVARSFTALPGPVGNVASQVSSAAGELALLGSTAGIAAGGLVALTGVTVGLATSIFNLTTNVAEATGKFIDLSQQTGFSVETLSALANAAETSGGSINTVVGALGIFERNMVEAQDSTSEMSRLFKQLTLDTNDNEKALRQALERLRQLPPGAERTALAMRLFGRSGREVSAIMDEMGGTLDDFMDKLRAAGVLIGTETARQGDKLSDSLIEMNRQFEAVKRMVAGEFAPVVFRAITGLTEVIETNKGTIRGWITEFDAAARGAGVLANAVSTLGGLLTGLNRIPVPSVLQFLASFSGAGGVFRGLQAIGGPSGQLDAGTQAAITRQMNALGQPRSVGRPNFSPFRAGALGAPHGGGGGGRRAKQERDEFAELLRREQRELGALTATTEVQRTALELLDDKYKKLTASQRDQILTIARQIDLERQRIEIQNQIKAFTDEQNQSIRELSENLNSHLGRTDAQIKAWERMGAIIPSQISWWARFNATILDANKAAKDYADTVERLGPILRDLTVPDFDQNKVVMPDLGLPPIDYAAELARIREEVSGLALDLTDVIDRAIYDGLQGGFKRGIQALTLGILDIIKNVFLARLQAALTDALAGVAVSTGGGGILKTLFGIGLSAIGGGIGGGGARGGMIAAKASGGPVYAGTPYLVGERGPEWVIPQHNGMVLPHGKQPGGTTYNINIAMPPESRGSYNPKISARQQAEMLASAIQSRLK